MTDQHATRGSVFTTSVAMAATHSRTAPRLERYAVTLALSVYFIFQCNAVLHHGYWGQDFEIHRDWIAQALANPWRFFTTYQGLRTNPPLYHLFGALMYKIAGRAHYLEALALVTALLNGAALLVLYRLTLAQIRAPALRVACFTFLLFLPSALIHAVVVAADAVATPVFVAVVYLLTRVTTAGSTREYVQYVIGVGVLVTIGVGVKFTFGSLVVASALALLTLWRVQSISGRRLFAGLAILAVAPGVPTAIAVYQYRTQQTFNAGLHLTGSEMNLRSLLFVRGDDVDVLDAPPYNQAALRPAPARGDTPSIPLNLCIQNKHSYPALLHLGIYTDILNIYQYDPYDSYFGTRTPGQQAKMRIAVRTAVAFSLLVVIGATCMLIKGLSLCWLSGKHQPVAMMMIGLAAVCWLLNIAAGLPFVRAYYGGYWLPRLVQPAILCFIVLAFIALDGWLARRSRAFAWACLAAAVCQSALHASFLWPTGVMPAFIERSARMQIAGNAPKASEPPCGNCPTSVAFVKRDAVTRGDWRGKYGSEGVAIANEGRVLPPYARLVILNDASTWLESAAGDGRAPQRIDSGAQRIASAWYGWWNISIEVKLTDGRQHQIALYCVDWDSNQRSQKLEVLDVDTDKVLDAREVSGFHAGEYIVWNMRGHTRIKVTPTGGNAVVSGIFFN